MVPIRKSDEIIKILRDQLPYLEEKYKVQSMSLFGSYSRNSQNSESDVDILVTFNETPGFIKFIKIENYLSEKLNLKVDLVIKNALKPHIGDRVIKDAVSV